jgi:hypothetical protein
MTLINCSAKQFSTYNDIRWASSFEQNADRYIVEYSANGNNFASAGDIAALNNNSGHSYSFRHAVTDTRKIYYRLQMLDRDGSARYSSIIAVGGNDKGNVTIYPTVLQNKTLQLTGNVSLDKLTVFNSSGKEVYRNNLNGVQGYFSITLPELAKGIYLVSLSGKNFNQTKKIIIQ